MNAVTVFFHFEQATWWVESPDVPGFSAAADTIEGVRALTAKALDSELGEGTYFVHEVGGVVSRPATASVAAAPQHPSLPLNAGSSLVGA